MAQGNGEEIAWLEELVAVIRDHHGHALDDGGGLPGEHTEKLYAACARPFHTAFGQYLFRSPVLVTAAMFHGIITSHVFVDGNKRTASITCLGLLAAFGYGPSSPPSFKYGSSAR